MENSKIRFVVATRECDEDFFLKTAAGQSLKLYENRKFELDLYPSNVNGLPSVYNQSILKSKNDPAILVFIHDDLHILDLWWDKKIRDSLNNFDVVGVCGNKRRLPNQPTWACADGLIINGRPTIDWGNLSGAVGEGQGFPPSYISVYGPTPESVKLLDGMFLACQSDMLLENSLFFDERFDFHFYDLDFCRQAELKSIKMGTIEISLIHESNGTIDDRWREGAKVYFEKWTD